MATYDETVEDKTTQEVTLPPKATRRVLSPSLQISEVFGHPFRSNPDTRFGVFGHLDRVGH